MQADTSEYTAVRFEYAKNGEAVAFALGEKWCWDENPPVWPNECVDVANYAVTWAKEFRYDGARQRYAVYDLAPGPLTWAVPILSYIDIRWSHYEGDDVFSDQAQRNFEAGIARVEPAYLPQSPVGGADTMYYHTDHLGTTRLMTDASGYAATGWHDPINGADDVTPSVFTAFGEHISTTDPHDGEGNRYGYIGAHGYQAHASNEMPFLHVGHRYYDPRSGRFLQRDPVGIRDGTNVYVYVGAQPALFVDPSGLGSLLGGHFDIDPQRPGGRPRPTKPTAPPGPTRAQTKQNLDRWANTFWCIAGGGGMTAAAGAGTGNPVLGVGGAAVAGVAGTIAGLIGLVNSLL